MKASQISRLDFFNDLNSRYARRWFTVVLLGLALLCILATYLVMTFCSGPLRELLQSIFIQLASSALLIWVFYILYFIFIGPNLNADIRPVRPQDIRYLIGGLTSDTSKYCFWGRSGSYFRSVPLRVLDEIARSEKKMIAVDVVLPDPNDPGIAREYSRIQKALGERPTQDNSLLINVLATCICCAVLRENNKFLQLNVYLSRHLPTYRIDLSDQGVLVTQDDAKKSAIFAEADSEFWEMFHSSIQTETNLARKLEWSSEAFSELVLDERACTLKTLSAFGIEFERTSQIQEAVASRIAGRSHRYQ